jgi:Immunity protein 8
MAQVPVLKRFDCTDIDPVERWLPASSEVCYWLTLSIGTADSEAADDFQVCVATPDGLKSSVGRRIKPKGATPPPIVLQEYSWDGVLLEIDRRLAVCAGTDWAEMQEKLRLLFNWEYEGYKS